MRTNAMLHSGFLIAIAMSTLFCPAMKADLHNSQAHPLKRFSGNGFRLEGDDVVGIIYGDNDELICACRSVEQKPASGEDSSSVACFYFLAIDSLHQVSSISDEEVRRQFPDFHNAVTWDGLYCHAYAQEAKRSVNKCRRDGTPICVMRGKGREYVGSFTDGRPSPRLFHYAKGSQPEIWESGEDICLLDLNAGKGTEAKEPWCRAPEISAFHGLEQGDASPEAFIANASMQNSATLHTAIFSLRLDLYSSLENLCAKRPDNAYLLFPKANSLKRLFWGRHKAYSADIYGFLDENRLAITLTEAASAKKWNGDLDNYLLIYDFKKKGITFWKRLEDGFQPKILDTDRGLSDIAIKRNGREIAVRYAGSGIIKCYTLAEKPLQRLPAGYVRRYGQFEREYHEEEQARLALEAETDPARRRAMEDAIKYGIKFGDDYTVLLKVPGKVTLTSYSIPSCVTRIGPYAFRGDNSFTSIIIPGSVTGIGHGAFDGCNRLAEVVIHDGVTEIGDSAFSWCTNLANVVIPDSVERIGQEAFKCCPVHFILGKHSLFHDDDGVLYNKDRTRIIAVSTTVTRCDIHDGITEIDSGLFWNCKALVRVTIPRSVTKIGSEAFYGCKSLVALDVPEGVTEIGSGAFKACEQLVALDIPDSVTKIGQYAFEWCHSLTLLTLPKRFHNRKDLGIPDKTRVTWK